MVNWNCFEVTCKNVRAIFTHSINFTGPLNPIHFLLQASPVMTRTGRRAVEAEDKLVRKGIQKDHNHLKVKFINDRIGRPCFIFQPLLNPPMTRIPPLSTDFPVFFSGIR